MMKHHLDCMEDFGGAMDAAGLDGCGDGGGDAAIGLQRVFPLVGLMNDVLAMLSLELYRKQCLVHIILETSQDDLIQIGLDGERLFGRGGEKGDDDGVDWEDLGPQETVNRCCKIWKRQCKESCIDVSTLSSLLEIVQ
mmetsp:Transcript_3989/g.6061  ORF Transcript_3989/g.6061 Transcript_3989/m.6061 type:complete len:138 (+) Transcript_3989:41-454(+)